MFSQSATASAAVGHSRLNKAARCPLRSCHPLLQLLHIGICYRAQPAASSLVRHTTLGESPADHSTSIEHTQATYDRGCRPYAAAEHGCAGWLLAKSSRQVFDTTEVLARDAAGEWSRIEAFDKIESHKHKQWRRSIRMRHIRLAHQPFRHCCPVTTCLDRLPWLRVRPFSRPGRGTKHHWQQT